MFPALNWIITAAPSAKQWAESAPAFTMNGHYAAPQKQAGPANPRLGR